MVVDGGSTWVLRVGAEAGGDGKRYLPIEFRRIDERRFRRANHLREED